MAPAKAALLFLALGAARLPGAIPATGLRESGFVDAGWGALERKEYDLALFDFNSALRQDPKDPLAYACRALVRVESGKLTEAKPDLDRALALAPKNAWLWAETGYCLLRLQEPERAKADLDVAIGFDPGRSLSYAWRAEADQALHQPLEAERDYNRCVERASRSALPYGWRAEYLIGERRWDEAVEDLTRAVWLAPKNPHLYFERSVAEWHRRQYREAVLDLYAAVQLDPQSALYLNDCGWYLAVDPDATLRDGARAVADATQACGLTGWKDAGCMDTLAAACAEAGDFAKAAGWEARALSLDPKLSGASARLALYQAGKPYREPPPQPDEAEWPTLRFRTFKSVWETVDTTYYDPAFGGLDWTAVGDRYRDRLVDAPDLPALRALLESMLATLRRTHFEIIPKEAAVFDLGQRSRMGSTGASCTILRAGAVVDEVRPDSAAAQAGLRPGDTIARIDGVDLAQVAQAVSTGGMAEQRAKLYLATLIKSRLDSPPGTKVRLEVVGADGKSRAVQVVSGPRTGPWSQPVGYFPSFPIRYEARRGADGIAYVRFDSFVPQVMRPLRAFIRSLRPGDGLVLDLRENSGGLLDMAPGVAGLLCDRQLSFGTMHLRGGEHELIEYPQRGAFAGPVAVLIGTGSLSSSEVLAAGLQEAHRARLFGEATPGAVLSSQFRKLPDGDLLQYAVADVETANGVMLEGRGVVPDEHVAETRADLAKGRDGVLDAARRWLDRERASRAPGKPAV